MIQKLHAVSTNYVKVIMEKCFAIVNGQIVVMLATNLCPIPEFEKMSLKISEGLREQNHKSYESMETNVLVKSKAVFNAFCF